MAEVAVKEQKTVLNKNIHEIDELNSQNLKYVAEIGKLKTQNFNLRQKLQQLEGRLGKQQTDLKYDMPARKAA